MKAKIFCPNHYNHTNREKILMVYDSVRSKGRFWSFCFFCRQWFQIDINKVGGVKVKSIVKDYHFDFKDIPVFIEE
jgi:hypothetical protein